MSFHRPILNLLILHFTHVKRCMYKDLHYRWSSKRLEATWRSVRRDWLKTWWDIHQYHTMWPWEWMRQCFIHQQGRVPRRMLKWNKDSECCVHTVHASIYTCRAAVFLITRAQCISGSVLTSEEDRSSGRGREGSLTFFTFLYFKTCETCPCIIYAKKVLNQCIKRSNIFMSWSKM